MDSRFNMGIRLTCLVVLNFETFCTSKLCQTCQGKPIPFVGCSSLEINVNTPRWKWNQVKRKAQCLGNSIHILRSPTPNKWESIPHRRFSLFSIYFYLTVYIRSKILEMNTHRRQRYITSIVGIITPTSSWPKICFPWEGRQSFVSNLVLICKYTKMYVENV